MPFSRDELEAGVPALLAHRRGRRGLGRLGRLFTEDAHYVEHVLGTMHGREAIRAWIKPIMAQYGELYTAYEWHRVDEETGRAIVYMQNRRDHPSGQGTIDFPGITILHYAGNGRWSREEDFWAVPAGAARAEEYAEARARQYDPRAREEADAPRLGQRPGVDARRPLLERSPGRRALGRQPPRAMGADRGGRTLGRRPSSGSSARNDHLPLVLEGHAPTRIRPPDTCRRLLAFTSCSVARQRVNLTVRGDVPTVDSPARPGGGTSSARPARCPPGDGRHPLSGAHRRRGHGRRRPRAQRGPGHLHEHGEPGRPRGGGRAARRGRQRAARLAVRRLLHGGGIDRSDRRPAGQASYAGGG